MIEKAQEPGGTEPAEPGVVIKSYDAGSKTAVIEAESACAATVVFAAYADNLLTDVALVEAELMQGENVIKADGFDTAGATSGCVLVWENITNLKPLGRAYVFEVSPAYTAVYPGNTMKALTIGWDDCNNTKGAAVRVSESLL